MRILFFVKIHKKVKNIELITFDILQSISLIKYSNRKEEKYIYATLYLYFFHRLLIKSFITRLGNTFSIVISQMIAK